MFWFIFKGGKKLPLVHWTGDKQQCQDNWDSPSHYKQSTLFELDRCNLFGQKVCLLIFSTTTVNNLYFQGFQSGSTPLEFESIEFWSWHVGEMLCNLYQDDLFCLRRNLFRLLKITIGATPFFVQGCLLLYFPGWNDFPAQFSFVPSSSKKKKHKEIT